jgi:cytochrome c peroxidase
MMSSLRVCLCASGLLLGLVALAWNSSAAQKQPANDKPPYPESLDWQLPNERLMQPFKHQVPIYFVTRTQSAKEWNALPRYWNVATEKTADPATGEEVTRKVIKIKVPLGLTQPPPVPPENPMTLARWALGKRLYFDGVLSADNSVSCASCHDPRRGWTDRASFSVGIGGLRGGVSAPTVLNSAYNPLQFWDGRAVSLEDQAQGPVQNPVEMFAGDGHAWPKAVLRVRQKEDYVRRFREAFGTEPTRDSIAKALATFERTVLSGNSIHDRADLAMRRRVSAEGGAEFTLQAVDYELVLKEAFKNRDEAALTALGLNPGKDLGRAGEVAKSLASGRELFFNKARCATCHVGDNFTDNQFHNLGVGVKDGKLLKGGLGRYAAQPAGHKNPELAGAFKTPTLRGLVGTGPYLHDGSEKTLEDVVEFYDRGGNANEHLSPKMRDIAAEQAYERSRRDKTPYRGPEVKLFGEAQRPIVPLKLNLTRQEKADLVLFLRALEGDPVEPIVADPRLQLSGSVAPHLFGE